MTLPLIWLAFALGTLTCNFIRVAVFKRRFSLERTMSPLYWSAITLLIVGTYVE